MAESDPSANRLFLAHKDMQDVARYLAALEELAQLDRLSGNGMYFDHCEAILVAAIVAYCRPFKKSTTGGHADCKLDAGSLSGVQSSPELKALHDLVLDRRDKAVAHADWTERSTELICSGGGTSVMRRAPNPEIVSGLDIELFKKLSEVISQECLRKTYERDRKSIEGGAL